MTESDWLASTDPAAMLRYLTHRRYHVVGAIGGEELREKPLVSYRKLRLFACAISRRMVMRYSLPDIGSVEDACDDPATDWNRFISPTAGASCGYWCAAPDIQNGLAELLRGDFAMHNGKDAANLLREIVGNPFRPVTLVQECGECNGRGSKTEWVGATDVLGVYSTSTAVDSSLRKVMVYCKRCLGKCELLPAWLTPTVISLATAAYEERPGRPCTRCTDGIGREEYGARRDCPDCHCSGIVEDGPLDPVRLAVLADALEEAGCTNEDILRHLRGISPCPGTIHTRWSAGTTTHVRGCWVLDLLLGRE